MRLLRIILKQKPSHTYAKHEPKRYEAHYYSGAAVAKEEYRNPYYRHYTNNYADINYNLPKEHSGNTKGNNCPEFFF